MIGLLVIGRRFLASYCRYDMGQFPERSNYFSSYNSHSSQYLLLICQVQLMVALDLMLILILIFNRKLMVFMNQMVLLAAVGKILMGHIQL